MIIFDYWVFNKFHFLIVLDNCFESNMLLILLSVTMYLHWEMINIFPLGNYQYISTGKLSLYFRLLLMCFMSMNLQGCFLLVVSPLGSWWGREPRNGQRDTVFKPSSQRISLATKPPNYTRYFF